jgi:predicted nucleotidyltransferase
MAIAMSDIGKTGSLLIGQERQNSDLKTTTIWDWFQVVCGMECFRLHIWETPRGSMDLQ